MTLGGEGTESRAIPDPSASSPAEQPAQVRVLNIWQDGWSIEDGPLRRFDDPQHAADLQMIRSGRAPVHLMDVRPDQAVDVHLKQHEGNYVAQKKAYKPFSGGGQRLGSPTPGGSGIVSAPPPAAAAAPAASTSSGPPSTNVDESQPTLSLRLQLANGTRLPARFNTTQTIGDVYDFVERASASNGRQWVLATTFPNKDHTDKSAVLGEMAEFKRGGTAVQKWL
jgi:UBX domain-containing protein 1